MVWVIGSNYNLVNLWVQTLCKSLIGRSVGSEKKKTKREYTTALLRAKSSPKRGLYMVVPASLPLKFFLWSTSCKSSNSYCYCYYYIGLNRKCFTFWCVCSHLLCSVYELVTSIVFFIHSGQLCWEPLTVAWKQVYGTPGMSGNGTLLKNSWMNRSVRWFKPTWKGRKVSVVTPLHLRNTPPQNVHLPISTILGVNFLVSLWFQNGWQKRHM